MAAPYTDKDIAGKRFARLVVVKIIARVPVRSKDGQIHHTKLMVEFKCDCGNTKVISYTDVHNGHTRSCGCLLTDFNVKRNTKHGDARRGNISREWITWNIMISRCHFTYDRSYERYGGRGITVCERWRGKDGFKNFLEDMGRRPSKDHSIERKDNTKGYSPDNCIWADRITQANNKRNNVHILWNGQSYTVAQLMRSFGVYTRTGKYYGRLARGWSVERTFNES